ncbi:MAG: M14 family metallopeptidase [Kiritimatiellia bacterium]|nr:M14 family metallopeptidase [Kiritimatiellia bacterium]
MARKLFSMLRITQGDGKARLSFYKGTLLFESPRGKENEMRIRVYRKDEPDFQFGLDYDEYFNGIDWRQARVIYDGKLAADNLRKFEFFDKEVEPLMNYAYWVSADEGDDPVGPVAVRIRSSEVWWPYSKICARIKALAENNPTLVRVVKVGATARGRDLEAVYAGNSQRMIALTGTVHPGESGPEIIIPVIERLIDGKNDLLNQIGIAALPSVGADERERLVQGHPCYLRVNAKGVDINRNFDSGWETANDDLGYGLRSFDPESATYRGPAPTSEPETRAIMNFIRNIPDLPAVFSYHALASICGGNLLFAKGATDDSDYAARCRQLADWYAAGMYPDEKRGGAHPACTPGSLPDWVYATRKAPAFDLEYDGYEPTKPCMKDFTTPELLSEHQTRHYNGLVNVLVHL